MYEMATQMLDHECNTRAFLELKQNTSETRRFESLTLSPVTFKAKTTIAPHKVLKLHNVML